MLWLYACCGAWIACRQTGWARPARKWSGTTKYVLRNHQYVQGCTLQKREKWSTKSLKNVCTQYIPVHTIWWPSSMYQVHTFFIDFVPENQHFSLVWTWYIPVHTREKKYEPSTYFVKKVRTRYKPVYVRLYRYHTIAWSIPVVPVCTGCVQLVTIPDVSRICKS